MSGPKSAAKLLNEYGTLEGIYENLETNYDEKYLKEELTILENDVEIQQIIKNLELKKKREDNTSK